MKHYKHDEVITLPSSTEIDIDSARGDLIRARASIMEGAADEHQQVDEAIAADLLRVEELLLVLAGCTGVLDPDHGDRLQHDGDTCPVHEDETISSIVGVPDPEPGDLSWYLVSIRHDGDEWGTYAVQARSKDEARQVGVARAPEPDITVRPITDADDGMADDEMIYAEVRLLLDRPSAQARDPRIIVGALYIDLSREHAAEPYFRVLEYEKPSDAVDIEVAATAGGPFSSGPWLVLHGEEGFIAKLDAGVVKRVQES